jgi:nucleoside-diphosphate-sugar epimerase
VMARSDESWNELIAALRAAAPPGLSSLDPAMLARLERITSMLLSTAPEAVRSAEDFELRRERRLGTDQSRWSAGIEGCVVLVTGGTGCIGSVLLDELRRLAPKRLYSLSRRAPAREKRIEAVDYLTCDIADEAGVQAVLERTRPDVVFHLAAQRDPGLAERTVRESLDTNIFGTRNVLSASAAAGVRRLVYASTGKALRPFTPHIYAASKKIGELLCLAADREHDMRVSAARFTHVVDNSLVLRRFRAVRPGAALRLHDPHIYFYTQSAREAAQLLLLANVMTHELRDMDVIAIQDLGMPTGLMDLALAVVSESPVPLPIYIAGYEAGYEDSIYPGLYDPDTAADVSPLFNAFEAAHARHASGAGVDASPLRIRDPERIVAMLATLAQSIHRDDAASLRAVLNAISLDLLNGMLEQVEPSLIRRLLRLTAPRRDEMGGVDGIIDDCLRKRILPAAGYPQSAERMLDR